MKQPLGAKKRKRIEDLTGKPVWVAYTRGSWKHFVAEVEMSEETWRST